MRSATCSRRAASRCLSTTPPGAAGRWSGWRGSTRTSSLCPRRCSRTTSCSRCGGSGTSSWWSGRSDRRRARAGPPAPPISVPRSTAGSSPTSGSSGASCEDRGGLGDARSMAGLQGGGPDGHRQADHAQAHASEAHRVTFSIVAADPEANEVGVAVQSKFLACAALVSWARGGVGAVATQAFAEVTYGRRGLDLLGEGAEPHDVIGRLTEDDPMRGDRKSTRLNSSHEWISYAVFCLKKKKKKEEKSEV